MIKCLTRDYLNDFLKGKSSSLHVRTPTWPGLYSLPPSPPSQGKYLNTYACGLHFILLTLFSVSTKANKLPFDAETGQVGLHDDQSSSEIEARFPFFGFTISVTGVLNLQISQRKP